MQNDSHGSKGHLGLYTGARYPGESVWGLAFPFDILEKSFAPPSGGMAWVQVLAVEMRLNKSVD
jgi:hypothetical protein